MRGGGKQEVARGRPALFEVRLVSILFDFLIQGDQFDHRHISWTLVQHNCKQIEFIRSVGMCPVLAEISRLNQGLVLPLSEGTVSVAAPSNNNNHSTSNHSVI